MPPTAHGGTLRPRRIRRDDEGEEEGSINGDLDDVSMSEGSAISNLDDDADVEGSDVSADDDVSVAPSELKTNHHLSGIADNKFADKANGRPQFGTFNATADMQAMRNGLEAAVDAGKELQFDDTHDDGPGASSEAPPVQRQEIFETPAQRSKREHLEYLKQRDSDPAFVPNRGGFFLHDDRSSSAHSNFGRPYQRGRGRGGGLGQGPSRGYGSNAEPTDKQWAHDLHESVSEVVRQQSTRVTPSSSQVPTAKPAAHPPNRTFSVTTTLGNVTVHLSLPGVEKTKTFSSVVKKQYTLLPQHRPPLRRDKPVRISIPDEPPRFIFPSTDRSFIFIPRAMRPNQQSFARGRGRGSFHGSRRTSMLGGSMYTPSIGMSRKSSISGIPTNGMHTPTESMMRGAMYPMNMPRPVVRMPIAPIPIPMLPHPYAPVSGGPQTPTMPEYGGPGPAILHSPMTVLPMYQPRPQKAVSISEIESPNFKAPQQQQEQPFHQQVPTGVSGPDHQLPSRGPAIAATTPLSHIPEGAVYAQPFQPYSTYVQPAYYGYPYNTGPMYYQPGPDGMSYMPVGGSMMPPQLMTAAAPAAYGTQPTSHDGVQGSVAQETNGMVYYYNQMQYPVEGSMPQYPVGGMMGSNPYYFPPAPHQGMYYPPPPG